MRKYSVILVEVVDQCHKCDRSKFYVLDYAHAQTE